MHVGKVIEGEETLKKLYKGYGDIPPFGTGPDQRDIYEQVSTVVVVLVLVLVALYISR
jgi:hypothetical protein